MCQLGFSRPKAQMRPELEFRSDLQVARLNWRSLRMIEVRSGCGPNLALPPESALKATAGHEKIEIPPCPGLVPESGLLYAGNRRYGGRRVC